MLVAIGEIVLDEATLPTGQLKLGDEPVAAIDAGGGGRAANFCVWAASLGESTRLITPADPPAPHRAALDQIEMSGVEVRTFALQTEAIDEAWLGRAVLLHLPAASLFGPGLAAVGRRAAEVVRAGGGVLSVDVDAPGLQEMGAARVAFEMAKLRPEILFATEAGAAALGVPLEGLAKVPVTKLRARGVRVFGRQVPAPIVNEVDPSGAGDAFAAAFCAAYVDGATPLEAAGRAVLVAAAAVARPGARP